MIGLSDGTRIADALERIADALERAHAPPGLEKQVEALIKAYNYHTHRHDVGETSTHPTEDGYNGTTSGPDPKVT